MIEIQVQAETPKKTLNPNFKIFFHQAFADILPQERAKFLVHDFNTLITPIGLGVDLAIEGLKLSRAAEIRQETHKIRSKANRGDLSNLTEYLRSIDKIIDLTKNIDSHGDEFVEKYIKHVPWDRRVVSSFIDVIRFLKNPGDILWSKVQEGRATVKTVLQNEFPKNQANINLDSAQAVVLHNVFSKFSDYFKDVEVKIDEGGGIVIKGVSKFPTKPLYFERYTKLQKDRTVPTKEDILNNNGINFSNGLFMAELLCLASNREISISYNGDLAVLQIK
ncbi:hypothetical protein HZA76_00705 [Candidatus Roizmanbacteria bacterium]|nr:hypothetical protein [Candidatus Roizmanbacteria bacterium]